MDFKEEIAKRLEEANRFSDELRKQFDKMMAENEERVARLVADADARLEEANAMARKTSEEANKAIEETSKATDVPKKPGRRKGLEIANPQRANDTKFT